MNKRKIHPIYFNSFVGTWKRTSLNGDPVSSDYLIKFNKDCTFEELLQIKGTVNGDVDEVSVDGDGEGHQTALKQVKGRTLLIKGRKREIWAYQLTIEIDSLTNTKMKKLQLKNKQTNQMLEFEPRFKIKPRLTKPLSRVKI